MEHFDKEHIRGILGNLECDNELKCVESGFEELCKARDFGSDSFLTCLEEDPRCSFASTFAYGRLCKCPVRMHILKKFNK